MDQAVADEYKSSLNDLNFNSKPLINMLTMLADENKKHAATIVKTIVDHINSAPLEAKLPGLYLVDSIMKNLGDDYMKIFCQQIVSLFTSVFEKVDENTRSLMFKLRQTWTDILPNKILYNLDLSVKKLDPAWPVTAKNPSKKILINPKFIDGSSEKKKTSENPVDSTPLRKEEDQIKQKQGEVLKQLLAKQEQLRQLEIQKLQLSIKKNNTSVGPNVPASSTFKKNLRDPRMVKINVSQNISPIKPCSNRVAQEKPVVVSKLEVCQNNSNISSTKSTTSVTKTHAQTSSSSNVNHVENCVKASDHQTVQQKKVSPKNKTDKNTMNKSKQAQFSSSKVGELKCALTENAEIASKTKPFVKSNKIEELKCSVTENAAIASKAKPFAKYNEVEEIKGSVTENTAIASDAKPFVKHDKIEDLKCTLTENTAITSKAKPFVKSNKIEDLKCSLNENTAITGKAKPFVKYNKIEDLKCNLAENTAITSKANKPLVKTGTCSVQILEKSFKDFSKRLKMVPKKKNTPGNNKIPQLNTTNASGVLISKKVSPVKIPKKSEKQKYPSKSDLSSYKVISKDEKDQITSFAEYANKATKHNLAKLNDIANKPKSVKTSDSQESVSDLSVIAKKDEDLRVKPMSLKEDTASVRVPKRDIVESSSLSSEMDDLHPPRKKIRADDAENCNPENRSELPDLFGSEDQDLRLAPFSDMNSKDWSQYKANHPDEYSPSPTKQESFEGKNRLRKHQFSDKYYNSPDYDRSYPRHSRGRYFAKRNFHRKYFPRGSRGQFPYNSPLASVMLDSRAFLRQAEEKFLSGRLSENEYIDLRRDLQKMVESSEYELFRNYYPQKQEIEHHVRLPENEISKQEFEHEPERVTLDNIRIQRSSVNPPPEKTFVLDDKERTVHFIDDKAIVLMDDNGPRELTFKDEQREVYIDGMAKPLTMGFDGKSVEFQVDGRRHVMRFGIPGRELYINDHPFEAQFGGPPLVAMLDDGHVYKIHVAGPAPQVVIGTEPQCELFAKLNHDGANTSKVQDSNIKYDIPSSCSLQDVDMRMKPDSVSEHDMLLNKDSPFYCEDMKDIDWRKMPPSSSLKDTEKNIPSIVKENVASSYETWINEDSLNSTSLQDRNNEAEKSVPKDATQYEWEITEQKERSQPQDDLSQQRQHPLAHVQQQRPHPPENLSQQRPHPPEDLSQQGPHPPEDLSQQRPHPPEDLSQQEPHPPKDLSEQRQHPLAHVQQQRPHPPEDLSQQRPHPPEDLSQQRQHPLAHVQQQRPHPPNDLSQQRHHPTDHLDLQRQHPMEHIQQQSEHLMEQPEHLQRQHPREHIQQQNEHLMEHPEHLQRLRLPEHVQQHPSILLQQNQHPSVHMQPQHSSVHMQQHHQHQSVHMHPQPQELLYSENALPASTSQKWTYKRDNNYWQNATSNHFRKTHQSSYLEESNAYRPTEAPSNQHFEDQGKYASRPHPHPHPSYAPYPQRSSFQARHGRGRYPGPRYRFNADFGRPRQNTPLLEPPRPRFPAELHKPLLPPPPFPPPFLSTSVAHQADRDVHPRASTEIQKRPGLLPTPVLKSESPQAEPKMQVDIESLLEKLVAAGIINTKLYEEGEPEAEVTDKTDIKTEDDKDKEAEEASSEMEKIELTAESLRIHRPSLISLLHKGLQCATCGMRFKEMQNEQYSRHLDWHFRMNRREKDTKRAISRTWYYEIEDWIQFEEFDDFEERTPSYFELQADDNQPEVVEVPAVISVPATNDDQECCPVCLEKFQLFWVEDEEEWHFRNAVRHDNVTYHPACYEDFKKACEVESALKKSENTTNDSVEIEQELKDILNTLIEDVYKNVEVIDVPHQTDLPNAMEDVEVPPAEVHSEEEILEGKPGEEEIIGLISESDIEIDSECPKTETKMVVMQSGGITLKVKAESLQCHSPSNSSEKDTKVEDGKQVDDEEEIDFRPPTPDPNFEVQPPVSKGRELSGLCCIM